MRKLRYLWLASAVVAMAASCTLNRLEEPSASGREGVQVTLTAYAPDSNGGSKAMLVDGAPEVYWAPNEEIMVFQRDWGWGSFRSTNTEPAAVVNFQGWITATAGAVSPEDQIWALYPYSWKNSSFDETGGRYIESVLPSAQTAAAGTFDPKALLMAARSATTDLAFYHVGGGLKFKLTQDWIQQVEFRSNDGTPLAGRILIEMDGQGHPVACTEGVTSDAIVLTAPYGETLQPDTWYYLCCLPAMLEQGYTLIFRSEHQTGMTIHAGPAEVKRATWGVLDAADADVVPAAAENLIFNEIRYTTADGGILMPETYYYSWDGINSVPDYESMFGGNIISNTYEGGEGRILFDGPVMRIPNGGFNTDEGKKRLTGIRIPVTVTDIEENAFNGCSALEAVSLPSNLKTIGVSAFEGCSALSSINLPYGLVTIESYAFYGTALGSVEVPGSVRAIGDEIFGGCGNLTAFLGPLATADGRGLVIDGTLVYVLRSGWDYPVDYEVEAGITGLGAHVFRSYWELNSVTLPESLETVGAEAFAYCSNLEAFNGKFASEDHHLLVCDGQIVGAALLGVTELTVPGTVRSIAPYAFTSKISLTTLVLSEGVEKIGESAFESCASLQVVELPQSLTGIGDRVFLSCPNLREFRGKYAEGEGRFLVVDGTLKAVALHDMSVVNVPEGVTSISPSVFQYAEVTAVSLPAGLTAIGARAFMYCRHLTGITLPESLQAIGDEAFYNCNDDAFTTFTIPSGVTEVGRYIIACCDKLTSVTVLPTVPPSVPGNNWPLGWDINNAPIYVPTASLDAYKNANGWRYQTNYQAITE